MDCKNCGSKMRGKQLVCKSCGHYNGVDLYCNKCGANDVTVQAIPNKTKRRWIRSLILSCIMLISIAVCIYINRGYSAVEGAVVGVVLGVLLDILVWVIINIVFRFIPEPYDTLVICNKCGFIKRKK